MTRDSDIAQTGPPVIDGAALDRVAAATRPLTAEQCMERAAGALVDGELRREPCPSEEPSGPSPALPSAMS